MSDAAELMRARIAAMPDNRLKRVVEALHERIVNVESVAGIEEPAIDPNLLRDLQARVTALESNPPDPAPNIEAVIAPLADRVTALERTTKR